MHFSVSNYSYTFKGYNDIMKLTCPLLGGCGPPVAGDGVVIHNYTTTFEGSSITFTCEDGLFPNDTITATCTGGHWSTDLATYMCTGTTTSSSTTSTTNTCPVNIPAICLKTSDPRKGINNYNFPCRIINN